VLGGVVDGGTVVEGVVVGGTVVLGVVVGGGGGTVGSRGVPGVARLWSEDPTLLTAMAVTEYSVPFSRSSRTQLVAGGTTVHATPSG
jgi:hypothetical protein